MKKLLLIAALAMSPASAMAQILAGPPPLAPNASGTIQLAGVFQVLWPATERHGCLVQNNGGSPMALFIGDPALVSAVRSLVLAPGQVFDCGRPGSIIRQALSVSGTPGDAFFAEQW